MQSKPFFSVIIPAFNREKLIERALLSVLRQDKVQLHSLEVVVIDDKSTDQTLMVANEFARLHPELPVHIVALKKNLGRPGFVRNVGLEHARGEWITYLDSDDRWLPFHLLTVQANIRRYPDVMHFMTWWSRSSLWPDSDSKWRETYDRLRTFPHWAISTNSHAHHRKCLERVPRFNAKRWGEDKDFWDAINRNYPHRYVRIPTTVNSYVAGGNNLTYQFDKEIAQWNRQQR